MNYMDQMSSVSKMEDKLNLSLYLSLCWLYMLALTILHPQQEGLSIAN